MTVSVEQDPQDLWVHVEITPECGPVKYEFDPNVGLVVDRFMRMPMHYPHPYCYAPKTLCDDGDALDVLVMVPHRVVPNSWMRVRPVAVLVMEDEKGMDEKVLAVPVSDVTSHYDNIHDIADVSKDILDAIAIFFERYKDLDANKWSKIHGWKGSSDAVEIIASSMVKYQSVLI